MGDRAHHLPSQLSGGEQQRVCIARALINDPKIILADEPTGNLDAVNEEIVLRLLREFHQQGRTIVMVTHDPVVARLADRRIEFHHGKIASQEVFAMADEEQFDEVLEELWVLAEHGEIAEVERMEVHGALPVSLAIEKMMQMGLVRFRAASAAGPRAQAFRESVPRCAQTGVRFGGRWDADRGTYAARAANGRAASFAVIDWPSGCLPTAWRWTANLKSSNRPASSSTSSHRKRRTRFARSSDIRGPARMERRSRRGCAAEEALSLPELDCQSHGKL